MLSFLLATALHHDFFIRPFEPVNPVRLQLTPLLDGQLGKEEWDPIGENLYLQWEPGKIHVAGELPKGKQIVVSLDLKGDGWLVGKDNYQLRLWSDESGARSSIEQLDATNRKGPQWIDRPDMNQAISAAAMDHDGNSFVEGTFRDIGLDIFPSSSRDVWMRIDMPELEENLEPNDPRVCTKVKFDTERGLSLPSALKWAVQSKTRSVVEREGIKLRYNFEGGDMIGLKTISLRTEGPAEDYTNQMKLLFPSFDNKGRAFVDYTTSIDPEARTGYKIARAQLGFVDGPDGVVQASYRIAPMMEFSLGSAVMKAPDSSKPVSVRYIFQMYTRQNADGMIKVEAPEGWEVLKNGELNFKILGNQSADSRVMELKIPAGTTGTFPIRFTGTAKDQTVSQVCYLTLR